MTKFSLIRHSVKFGYQKNLSLSVKYKKQKNRVMCIALFSTRNPNNIQVIVTKDRTLTNRRSVSYTHLKLHQRETNVSKNKNIFHY